MAAHAHGAEGIKRAVRAGVRSIEHGSLMDDEAIALMKEHGTWLVADIWNGDYIDSVGTGAALAGGVPPEERRDHRGPAGRVPQGGGGRRQDRVRDRQRGLPARAQRPAAALHGAVRHDPDAGDPERHHLGRAADAWEDRVGSIAPGKYADIIAVEGDAMADLKKFEKVGFVMKGGVVYKGP